MKSINRKVVKKRYWFLGLMLLALTGCVKDRQCRCVYTDGSDDGRLKVFFVDPAIHCEDITEMAFEEKITEDGVHTLHRTDTRPVKCREYGKK